MSNGTTSGNGSRAATGASGGSNQAQSDVRGTVESLGENPLALVAGGVALGVLIGMLLPRLDRERELLNPLGKRLADGVTSAAKAAKEAGKAEIEALLPDGDAAKDRVNKVFGAVVDAAKGATAKAD